MRRRDFVFLVCSTAMVSPRTVIAESTDRLRKIGVLAALAENDPGWRRNLAGFVAGLKDSGWIEGETYRFESRYVPGGGAPESFQAAARELVALAPDVILAVPGGTAAVAIKRETHTIPIVFLLSVDPILEGLVTDFGRPGGNATGFTQSDAALGGKWLQLLKEIAPDVTRAAIVVSPTVMSNDPISRLYARSVDEAARSTGVATTWIVVHDEEEIGKVVTAFAQQPNGGLVIPPDSLTAAHRVRIIGLAAHLRLPAVYFARFCAVDGGLVSYGIDHPDLFRQGGGYAARILKGARPAELPVQTPRKFELVVNLKTANALGLTIPASLLARADEVIE